MMLSFWTDAIVAVLLVATIGYSALLNRRLTAMRNDRDKYEDVIRKLATASQRAEAATSNMRSTADDLGRRLDKKIDEARALSDDLVYMIERGGAIADKLVNRIRDGLKSDVKWDARQEPRAEHKVEPLLRAVPRAEAPRPAVMRVDSLQVETRRAAPPAERIDVQPQTERASTTSRAERELLRALARRR